jgi:uncharacterized caspase-like protein
MKISVAGWRSLGGLCLFIGALLATPALAAKHALLVGVGDYRGDYPGLDLEGPPHDVAALRQALIESWGFAANHVQTLVDAQATRAHILDAIDELRRRSRAGDLVVLYFSGHGTSIHDPKLGKRLALPDDSGAFLPWDVVADGKPDAIVASLIVGRTDLRPRLQQLDDGGRRTLVVFDTCYSGNAVRGVGHAGDPVSGMPVRSYPLTVSAAAAGRYFDEADAEVAAVAGFDYGAGQSAQPYPYRRLVFLSSATDRELATDIPSRLLRRRPTFDQRPHGAFTDALLRVLRGELAADTDHNRVIDYLELRNALTAYLAKRGFRQTPQLLPTLDQDSQGLASRALLSGDAPAAPPKPGSDAQQRSLRVSLLDVDAVTRRRIVALPGIDIDDEQPDIIIARHAQDLRLLTPTYETIVDLALADRQGLAYQLAQRRWFHSQFTDPVGASAPRLDLELADGLRGSSLQQGDTLFFHLRAARPLHLLLFDLMSDGHIAVLYPWREQELAPLAADRAWRIPALSVPQVRVTPPFGVDRVFALGADKLPAFARRLLGRDTLDATLEAELRRWLQTQGAGVGRATVTLHTGPRS